MLSRRDFASVASCALCSLTGFIATDASAQTPPATNGTPGVKRKILSQSDGPNRAMSPSSSISKSSPAS